MFRISAKSFSAYNLSKKGCVQSPLLKCCSYRKHFDQIHHNIGETRLVEVFAGSKRKLEAALMQEECSVASRFGALAFWRMFLKLQDLQ